MERRFLFSIFRAIGPLRLYRSVIGDLFEYSVSHVENRRHSTELITGDLRDKATGVFSGSGIKSDCDEQLLISLSFNVPVVLTSLTFFATNVDKAPHDVKIFANALNMDFDDAESRIPSAEFELGEGDIGKERTLVLAKFKRVNSLTVR